MQALDRSTRKLIADRYDRRAQRLHAHWKLAYDPVYAATAELIGNSTLPLLDIGCGIGLLGHYLDAVGPLPAYLGLDHDAHKIAAARVAARHGGLDAKMQLLSADVATLPPLCGHVALLDVLHYLPAERQSPLLQAAAAHLATTGVLVIRNVLREPSWRFHATRVEEFFLRVSGWIPIGAQHYPDADEIRTPLEAAGLTVQISPLRGNTPYNSYLIVARPRG